MLKEVLTLFSYTKDSERTIEINPETATKEKLSEIKKAGFNRISLGIQTFSDEILKSIGRNHTQNTIYEAIKNHEVIKLNNQVSSPRNEYEDLL